jgi:beta propeller repeat protein
MKMKKLYSVASISAAVILFLILVSSTASASITEKWITNHGTASSPAIYGNTIVWQDERNGNSDIYIYDLSTKKQTNTINLSNQTHPAIYGNKVVWEDDRNGVSDIYMYDISTKKETLITSKGKAFSPDIYGNKKRKAFSPDIYGNKIVWQDNRGVSPNADGDYYYDLYVYDLSTKKETQITHRGDVSHPTIYGNRIVWQSGFYGYYDVYMYDLSTKKQTQITKGGFALNPVIDGNRIVWGDNRKGNYDIYMYDISTKKETQITNNASDQDSPAIYGNSIAWSDNRNGNWNIYAYDLITKQQIRTTDKSVQWNPAIYGNKVVWTDYRNGKPDIYMGTISYLPVASFTASPTTGPRSLNVQFNDKSTDAYYWSWDFGDKSTSTLPSPLHKYTKAGKYSVTLKVKNAAGSNTAKKTNYITVK